MVRAGQNRREEARALLRRASASDPGHAATAFNLALLDFEDGKPAPAEAALAAFEAAHPPGDPRIAALRGRIAEEDGRADEAVIHYRRAVALDPLYALAHRNLGLTLARAGRLDVARPELEAALRLDPADAEVREFLKTLP
jgi:predicted Zn-dependent protease